MNVGGQSTKIRLKHLEERKTPWAVLDYYSFVALRRIKSQVDPHTRSRRFRHKILLFLDRTKNKVDQSFGNCPAKLFLAKQHDVYAGEIR